jgi:uncharacterized protein YqeY
MIADTITKQIGEAMKARDEIRLSTLRMLSSALNYEFIAKQHKLSEEEEIAVVRREVKKRNDAIEAYQKAGATDRVEKETAEKKILEGYLPAQMPDEELEKLVDEAINQTGAKTIQEMGKVIGVVMGRAAGKADGSKVAELVKKKLTV